MPLNVYIQHRGKGKTVTGGIHQPSQPLHYHVLFSLQKERLDKCNNCTAQSSFTCLRTKYKARGAIQTIMGSKISATLNWVDHANTITKNAISCLGFLRGEPARLPTETTYISLIQSSLEYCVSIWDPYFQKEKTILEAI